MNTVNLIGRLTANPNFQQFDGSCKATFNIAIDRVMKHEKREELMKQGKSVADFPPIVVWNRQAELAAEYLERGKLVGITGSIETDDYEKENGEKVYTVVVRASEIKYL